ncbi:MAG: M20/M25/M40 family metallo-hydrolase [Trueperaceae bacterium]|nr:M20/M25/M40 family metallo-hydrolase [Trueperaceae bacterium]
MSHAKPPRADPSEVNRNEADRSEDAQLRSLLKRVCETPAPTFDEGARATLVEQLLRSSGATPRRDAVGNVLAWLPGGHGPTVALVAHLDTVFGADVDVRVREENERCWRAPGIGDNSASVAQLLHLAAQADRGALLDRPRLLLGFTVGEEGLGDLRGARRLVADVGADLDAFVAVDGHMGSVVDAGVGSRRLRASFTARGGHSWGDYPSPSAVHALGDAVHALTRIPVPGAPRSSLNVGQVGGGSAVNAIAASSWLTLDLRSLDRVTLDTLRAEAEKRLRSVARRHRVELVVEPVGDRPAGRSDDGWLAGAASAALEAHGVASRMAASSTDANAAMAAGIPAVCLGVYDGGDAHRLEEWLDPTSLAVGASVLRDLLARLAEGRRG